MAHAEALACTVLLLLCCASEGGHIIFYNRVPKTGSTSFWHAIADAANQSQGRFKWHGVRYHDKVSLRLTDSDQDDAVPGSPAVVKMCKEFGGLAAQGDGVYALHTPFIDFPVFCPGSGVRVTYINFLRDPVDRLISGVTYMKSCICKNIQYPARKLRNNLWCKRMITNKLRREYKGKKKRASHYCSWDTNTLVAAHMSTPNAAMKSNSYVKYFCGWDPKMCRGDVAQNLPAAMANMEKQYAWVGILERQSESIRVLRAEVPMLSHIADIQHLTHSGDLHKGNASHGHSYTRLEPDVLARAKKLLAPDYAIYKRADEMLRQRLEKLE